MWEDKNNITGVVVGGVIWLMSGVLIVWNFPKLPPQIPLLYSLPVGEEQLITKPWLLAVWGGIGLLMWLDVILAWLVTGQEKLMRQYLIWGGVVTQVIWMLTLIKVISIII